MMGTRLRIAAVVGITALLAAGCGGASSNTAPASAGGELTFANWQWLEAGRGDAIWKAVRGYEKVNRKAKLKQQAVPYKDFPATMKAQIGAHGGPDLLVVTDTNYPELVNAGLLEPLDGVLPADEVASLNKTNEGAKINGKQYGYSWEVVNYALFWNKSLLARAGVKPPKDFQSLLADAKAIKAKTGVPGFAARHQTTEEEAWWEDFSNWPYGFGGGWSKDGKLTINSPKNIQAVEAFKKMYDSGTMPIGDDASTFRTKFQQGKIGMLIDNSSVALTVTKDNPVLSGKDIGASPLPFPTSTATHSAIFLAINKYAQHKELAKDFLKWFYSKNAQSAAAAALAPSTIGTDAPMPADFLAANPWVKVFKDQSAYTRSPVIDGFQDKFPQISHIVMQAIEKVLVNNVSASDALKQAQSEAERVAK
jgi:multiple sugar transport system substrate-binding protein